MKHAFRKFMSVILAAMMLICSVPFMSSFAVDEAQATALTITTYEVGDIIEFGWYPQSKVTNKTLISALSSAEGEWKSYGYYSGTGNVADGQMTAKDFMRYKDVVYGSEKYRGVVFDTYRPYATELITSASTEYTNQHLNGYTPGVVYWFKYEPIEWRVLDPDTGMIMSETILDSQAYNNYILRNGFDEYRVQAVWGDFTQTYYANNYAKSSIREWLNEDFYNTAFSTEQQNIIETTTLDNSALSDWPAYASETTHDKIYLLSVRDVVNENYGFRTDNDYHDPARAAKGSDYAQCQGLYVYRDNNSINNGNSTWFLRTAAFASLTTCVVIEETYLYMNHGVHYCNHGVRPALNLNPDSGIIQSDVKSTGNADIDVPEPVYYTTTWNAPGGKFSNGKEQISMSNAFGSATIAPSDPSKEGYRFIGWTPMVPKTMPANNLTFTAKFEPLINFEIRIPSVTTINYGDSIVLHADVNIELSEGYYIEWTTDNNNFSGRADSTSCEFTPEKTGNTVITATLYQADGTYVASDEQMLTAKAGFFQKLIAFFKGIFGLNKTIPEAFIF